MYDRPPVRSVAIRPRAKCERSYPTAVPRIPTTPTYCRRALRSQASQARPHEQHADSNFLYTGIPPCPHKTHAQTTGEGCGQTLHGRKPDLTSTQRKRAVRTWVNRPSQPPSLVGVSDVLVPGVRRSIDRKGDPALKTQRVPLSPGCYFPHGRKKYKIERGKTRRKNTTIGGRNTATDATQHPGTALQQRRRTSTE